MSNIYTFIDAGLNGFSDKGIYDAELKRHCIRLNELLNNVKNKDYDIHLKNNNKEIRKEIDGISLSINEVLFIDLSKLVNLLFKFQRDHHITARDHYYHSIQCFLLAIVLIEKFYPSGPLPENIIAILYSLTMYHDIGYLYDTSVKSEKEIDKSLANIFVPNDCFYESDFVDILCLRSEFERLVGENKFYELNNNLIKVIKEMKELYNIWVPEPFAYNSLLENDTGLPQCPVIYKNKHPYKSALILYKALKTKNLFKNYCGWKLKINFCNDDCEWFKMIIKAIYMHGWNSTVSGLNINSDFFTIFLMIIDELQTYGRESLNDKYSVLINPKDVGFEWDKINPKKIIIENFTTVNENRKTHNNREIWSKLIKKIDEKILLGIIELGGSEK